jgi:hypothetical protein
MSRCPIAPDAHRLFRRLLSECRLVKQQCWRHACFPNKQKPTSSEMRLPLSSNGSTELAGNAESAPPPGVPTALSWGDEVLALDEEELPEAADLGAL